MRGAKAGAKRNWVLALGQVECLKGESRKETLKEDGEREVMLYVFNCLLEEIARILFT